MSRIRVRPLGLAMTIIAVVVVATPVLSGLHHVTESHYWCPEHKTLEHPRGDRVRVSCVVAWNDAVDESSPERSLPSEHQTCPQQELLSKQYDRSDPARSPVATARLVEGDTIRPAAQRPLSSAPLLAYAPKLSPPA